MYLLATSLREKLRVNVLDLCTCIKFIVVCTCKDKLHSCCNFPLSPTPSRRILDSIWLAPHAACFFIAAGHGYMEIDETRRATVQEICRWVLDKLQPDLPPRPAPPPHTHTQHAAQQAFINNVEHGKWSRTVFYLLLIVSYFNLVPSSSEAGSTGIWMPFCVRQIFLCRGESVELILNLIIYNYIREEGVCVSAPHQSSKCLKCT